MTGPHPGILVVDDDSTIRQALRVTLGKFGFEVGEAASGENALTLVRQKRFDAVLLDVNMPGMDGVATCREMRRIAPRLAIIVLTVRDSTDEKVEAFEAGADDYVTKPFHVRELQARVRSAVRRFSRLAASPDESIRIGEISLDPARRAVLRSGRPVHLTPREFDLLRYLMMNAGKPTAHDRLLSAVWGPGYGGELEYLRTFIHQLRRKLEDDPSHPEYVLTDTWFGYRFREE